MAEKYLFNRLFIEYVQSLLFTHPNVRYDESRLFQDMPDFYKDRHMISSAIQILMMEDKIDHDVFEGKDVYFAKQSAIDRLHADTENDRLSKTVDLRLKQLNVNHFFLPKKLAIASIIVSIAALLIAGLNIYITLLRLSKMPPQSTVIKEQLLQNTTQGQTEIRYPQQKAEKKDSSNKK
jgi:hypothetical protein